MLSLEKIKREINCRPYRSLNSTKPETYNNYTVKEAELKLKVKEVRKLKRETKADYYNLEFNQSKNDIKKHGKLLLM